MYDVAIKVKQAGAAGWGGRGQGGVEMKGMGGGLNFYKKSATKFPANR